MTGCMVAPGFKSNRFFLIFATSAAMKNTAETVGYKLVRLFSAEVRVI